MVDIAFHSAAAFRHDFCNSIAELQQRFSRPLPDRATVYVVGAEALYRLIKGLGDSFDDLTGQIVIPADQSDNRWVQEQVAGASPWSGTAVAAATVTVSPAGSLEWQAIGSTASTFALTAGDALMFQLNPTSGLLTYHGLPRYMTISSNISIHAGAADIFQAVISINDDVPAGSGAAQPLNGAQATGAPDGTSCFVATQRSFFLNDGNTIRVMLRDGSGDAIEVDFFSVTVAPR